MISRRAQACVSRLACSLRPWTSLSTVIPCTRCGRRWPHASEAGIPEGRIRDVVLAVHELAANAVRHGAGQGRVQLWITGDDIRCEVTDAGAPSAGANGDRPDASSRDAAQWPVEHGHGLWLVRQVADQASLDSGPSGTVAVVNFRFASQRTTS
jgi:anti-sigma regulatory factor (Ser/Thr protein kinase)